MLLSFRPGLLALCPLLIPILFFTWPLPLIDLTVYPFTTVPARLNVAVSQGGCKFWILWYEHSIETSLAVLSHNIFFSQHVSKQIKLRNFEEFWLWPSLAAIMKGLGIHMYLRAFSSRLYNSQIKDCFPSDTIRIQKWEKVGRLRTDLPRLALCFAGHCHRYFVFCK